MNTSDSTTNMVVLEHTFDAPIGEVWQMWTDPAEFADWYGPGGASVAVCEMEVSVGGAPTGLHAVRHTVWCS
jgi:uncharacterized protein YndB with AHSA1/START domain